MSGSFTSLQLDTRAPEPLWRQLYSQLDDLLTSGAVQEGTSLPPERDLAEALGVSRSTVKRSYDQLRHDKRVGGRGRAGSVVRQPPERVQPTLGQLKGFTEEMQELGKFATSTLLVCEVVTDRRMASIFQRPSHARFLHIERIREADGVPMTRELAWYDLTLAPAMAEWDGGGSAYERLRKVCGLALGDWQALSAAEREKLRAQATLELYRLGAHSVIDHPGELPACLDDLAIRRSKGEKP